MSYDYTVLAGTQGTQNHRKKDRLFELAEDAATAGRVLHRGRGGRPGDTDAVGVSGLDCLAFNYLGQLSGLVPLVGINAGYCFAGNAAILGCCDVVIATEDSNIGMGGPAMIEGGGLGVFDPTDVGPMSVQQFNGVVDIAVADEAEAVARRQAVPVVLPGSDRRRGRRRSARAAPRDPRGPQAQLRRARGDRRRCSTPARCSSCAATSAWAWSPRWRGSRADPSACVANNPNHLAGAIDSDGADKAARFLQLCDAFDIPVVTLVDTPGMMVGPEVEETALVRHCCRLFVTGAEHHGADWSASCCASATASARRR